MITVQNYIEKSPEINFDILPREVRSFKDDIPTLIEFYSDPEIKPVVDDFIAVINKSNKNKKTSVTNKKTPIKDTSEKKRVSKKTTSKPPKRTNSVKDITNKAPKRTNSVKNTTNKAIDRILVNFWDEEDKLIRRFISLTKKDEVSSRSIELLHKAISKSALNRKIRKSDPDAELLNIIGAKIVYALKIVKDKGLDFVTINIQDKRLFELIEKFNKKSIDPVVTSLNSFVNIQGTTPNFDRCQRLLRKFKKLDYKNHRLNKEVEKAIELLQNKTDVITITQTPLSGVNINPHCDNPLVMSLSGLQIAQEKTPSVLYDIDGDFKKFLGQIEIKPFHSIAITLDAEQGAGKTRFVFQVMNHFAEKAYKCLFVSLEEHPQSQLFIDKIDMYISEPGKRNIDTIAELPDWYKTLTELIPFYDCIFIDSWNKIAEEDRKVDFDRDLRKKFDGKLFFTIFQQTVNGGMRGGAKAGFDGDVILRVQKDADFRKSYVYANKNRYQDTPLDQLRFNIFHKRLLTEKEMDLMDNPEKVEKEDNKKVVKSENPTHKAKN